MPTRPAPATAAALLFALAATLAPAHAQTQPEPAREAAGCASAGTVRLRAVLAANGEVTDITVLQGLPDGLTEKAIAAARQIKFKPARKDGRDVSQWVTLEYDFNIHGEDEEAIERKAVILEQPAAEYAAEAHRRGVTGKVLLDVWLCGNGGVDVKVVEGLPHGLTEKAVEAARRIKFTPAEDKGKKVSVRRRIEYHFPPS